MNPARPRHWLKANAGGIHLRESRAHHSKRRSAIGDDTETNLITRCRECHEILHRS